MPTSTNKYAINSIVICNIQVAFHVPLYSVVRNGIQPHFRLTQVHTWSSPMVTSHGYLPRLIFIKIVIINFRITWDWQDIRRYIVCTKFELRICGEVVLKR